MQRKSALVCAYVEGFSVRIFCRGRVVLPLVEKRAGFLPGSGIVVEAQPVEMEICARERLSLRVKRRAIERHIELLQLADARVGAFKDRRRVERLAQDLGDYDADSLVIQSPGEQLHDDELAVLIDDDPRQGIGLAENQPAGVGIGTR